MWMRITKVQSFDIHSAGVTALALRAGGTVVLSVAEEWDDADESEVYDVKVWGLDGVPRCRLRSRQCSGGVSLSARGDVLAAGTGKATIRLYEVRPKPRLFRRLPAPDLIAAPLFSPDGRLLAAGGSFGGVDLRSTSDFIKTGFLATEAVGVMVFSADSGLLAVGEQFGVVRVWDHVARTSRILGSHGQHVVCAAFSSDNTKLAAVSVDTVMKVWGGADWLEQRAPLPIEPRILSLGFLSSRNVFVSGDEGGFLKLWHLPVGQVEATLDTTSEVRAIATPDSGDLFLTGHASGEVTLWRVT
jgi:WD40 repeat protein